jgi:hypothetical protein
MNVSERITFAAEQPYISTSPGPKYNPIALEKKLETTNYIYTIEPKV